MADNDIRRTLTRKIMELEANQNKQTYINDSYEDLVILETYWQGMSMWRTN